MKFSTIASTLLTAGALVAASDLGFSQITLNASPGPSNNGGSAGWGMFLDLDASSAGVTITELTTGSTALAGAAFSIEVFVHTGTGLGGPVTAGAGSSPTGWTSLGVAAATQGATASGVSLPIDIPDIALVQNQVTGVALVFTGAGPRYLGSGTPPLSVFSDANLSLTTGDGRSAPFTPTGSFFSSRAMVGSVTYTVGSVSGPFCSGDGTGAECPCANNGTAGNGCANSVNANGANLTTTGTASVGADTLVLAGSGMPMTATALYFQGTTPVSTTFGDGLSCAGGNQMRLGTKINAAGASAYPALGDASISVRGGAVAGSNLNYQVLYRDAQSFCTSDTYNLTNAINVVWTP